MSGVRDARCASLLVCAWLQLPRALSCCCALPIKERAFLANSGSRIFRSLQETLPVLLCFVSALILSAASASGFGSASAIAAASSALLSFRLCSVFVSSSALHSPLLLLCLSSRHRVVYIRLFFSIRLCSAFARRSILQL